MSREHFYLLQHVHIYMLHIRKCTRMFLTCIMHVPCAETSNAEPPVSPARCFTCKPRCASALLQLYSIFHSNPRDWELKARWTFFNNEGILCLQFSTWLTRDVWSALQSERRQTFIILRTAAKCINNSSVFFGVYVWGRPVLSGSSQVLSERGRLIDSGWSDAGCPSLLLHCSRTCCNYNIAIHFKPQRTD